MENKTCTLEASKAFFSQCRQEAQNALTNQLHKQWNKLSLEKYSDLLTELGVNLTEISPVLKNYQKTANSLLLEVSRCENKLSNLEADINLNELSSEEAEKQAKLLNNGCAVLQPLKTTISQHNTILTEQTKRIHSKLTLKSLLTLASKKNSHKRKQQKVFEQGFKAFCLVTSDKRFQPKGMNLQQIEEAAEKIEAKLAKLESGLPPTIPHMSATIISCHIDTCLSSLTEIDKLVDLVKKNTSKALERISSLEKELQVLSKQPFAKVLDVLPDQTNKAIQCISEFQYKQHIIEEIERTPILLRQLQIFYESLRYSYFPHLENEINRPNSPLSPLFVAQQTVQLFFKGFSGFIRLVRLLYTPSQGQKKLSKKVLGEKIFIALTECPYYYCAGQKNSLKTTVFIEKAIMEYKKPYTHDELFKILKTAINEYGSAIEKDFFHYKAEQRDTKDKKIQLGRMLDKIDISMHRLQALREENS